MKKRFIFILITIPLLIGLNFQARAQSVENADLIELDKTEVVLPPPPGTRSKSGGCSDDRVIKVKVAYPESAQKSEDYRYQISGGKIIGSGAQINWDLSGVRPGTYTITISFQSEGKLKTQTKKITVRDCPDSSCGLCDCPTGITILTSTETVKPNETITIVAQVNGGSQTNPTYLWKISGGEIIEGQGTSQILVKPLKDKKIKNIEATIIGGGFCVECPKKESSITVEVIQPKSKK